MIESFESPDAERPLSDEAKNVRCTKEHPMVGASVSLRFDNVATMRAFKAAWLGVVFVGTYVLRASQETSDHPRVYYISELLNSAHDTPAQFALRWLLWLTAPLVTFRDVARQTSSRRFAGALTLSWYLLMASGLQLEVFHLVQPAWLRYFHYVATGLVQFLAALFYRLIGWTGVFYTVIALNVVYIVLFTIHDHDVQSRIADEVFIAVEYLLFGAYILGLYLREIELFAEGQTRGPRVGVGLSTTTLGGEPDEEAGASEEERDAARRAFQRLVHERRRREMQR